MNRLLEIGFQPVGHWLLDENSLLLELVRHTSHKNILYAFVSDGEVKYVGKTTRTLAARLAGYRTPSSTQATNLRNHHRIKASLASGAAVEILALPDNGQLRYGQFHLNLAAGLEDDIIRVVAPEWNGSVPEPEPATADAGDEDQRELPTVVGSFTFTLQPTYFGRGFFNVGAASQHYLGSDGETIELYLDEEAKPVLGTINRRANRNAAPRIMGGASLRGWFHAVAQPNETIRVDVFSPTEIRLAREPA